MGLQGGKGLDGVLVSEGGRVHKSYRGGTEGWFGDGMKSRAKYELHGICEGIGAKRLGVPPNAHSIPS